MSTTTISDHQCPACHLTHHATDTQLVALLEERDRLAAQLRDKERQLSMLDDQWVRLRDAHAALAAQLRKAQAATRRECAEELREAVMTYEEGKLFALADRWSTPAAPAPDPAAPTCDRCGHPSAQHTVCAAYDRIAGKETPCGCPGSVVVAVYRPVPGGEEGER